MKEEKEKNTFMKIQDRKKTPQKQGRILERGGGNIFLAGQNIYPCIMAKERGSFER